MDYQANSRKSKEQKEKPVKKVEPVVTGKVIIQKPSIGQKFKDTFIGAPLKTVTTYVLTDVVVPAARNLLYDAFHKGMEKLIYGDRVTGRRVGNVTVYNNPINRDPRGILPVRGTQSSIMSPVSTRYTRDEYILETREEAEAVLEQMNNLIEQYDVVTVGDLNEMMRQPSSHVDQKWGWLSLAGSQVLQNRDGFVIDLPRAQPID